LYFDYYYYGIVVVTNVRGDRRVMSLCIFASNFSYTWPLYFLVAGMTLTFSLHTFMASVAMVAFDFYFLFFWPGRGCLRRRRRLILCRGSVSSPAAPLSFFAHLTTERCQKLINSIPECPGISRTVNQNATRRAASVLASIPAVPASSLANSTSIRTGTGVVWCGHQAHRPGESQAMMVLVLGMKR
jgi:hypothetical protein